MRIHTASQLYPTYKQSVACMRLPFLNFTNYERARIETHAHTIRWIRPGIPLRWVSSISDLNNLYKTKPLFHFKIIVCKYVE